MPGSKNLFLLIALFYSVCTNGQNVIQVLDIESYEPIVEAAIYTKDKSFTGLTNKEGKVNIPKSVPFDDTLYFQHTSYYNDEDTYGAILQAQNTKFLIAKVIRMDEVTISASKIRQELDKVANKVGIIYPKEIAFSNPQTSADMLQNTGEVFIQKSQMGGGSPVIRGFEANKVLIVVDGVRMNNAIYRSGHLQNVITIDPAILKRTEVIFGPGSLIYGSDALGGVMHFYTKDPELSNNDSLLFKGNSYVRYGSANQEKSTHIDLNFGWKKLGYLSSITLSDYDDLLMGNKRKDPYLDFGERTEYIDRINGMDTIIRNTNPNRQVFTGYTQVDVLQKLLYRPSEKIEFLTNFQLSTSTNVPRYDRLNDYSNGQLRFAEWNYGPQNRVFGSFVTRINDSLKIFQNATITAAIQQIDEDRIDRKFNDPERRRREEDVTVYTLNIDFNKEFNKAHSLQYGFEATHNDVLSSAFTEDIETGEIGATSTRYPDGGSTMQTLAAYFNHKWNITDGIIISDGFRYSRITLESLFNDTTFFDFPFDRIELNTEAFTGSLGFLFDLGEYTQLRVLGSTGFRTPNVDDVGKVFDSAPGTVIVPNDDLGPENALNTEVTIMQKVKTDFKFQATGFYTWITNAIARREFTFNGQDSIMYDGTLSQVFANVNIGQAFIRGISVSFVAELTKKLSLKSSLNFTEGIDVTEDRPLGHIPPTFGRTGLTYQFKKLRFELFTDYNGWKRLKNYSPAEDKLEEATKDGTPAWYTMNLRSQYQLNPNFKFQLGFNNLFNHHYKPFASGISGPGRSVVMVLRAAF